VKKDFNDANFLINGKPIEFKIYQDQDGRWFIDLQIVEIKNEKSLDKEKKV
jgi:hypothetical protein